MVKYKKIILLPITLVILWGIYTNNVLIEDEINIDSLDVNNKEFYVHITGKIKNSGVYKFEKRVRINDVVKKAGGLSEDADLRNINLAAEIEDGQKIHIYSKNEIKDQKYIDLNIANKNQLETLKGIGNSTAEKIINYREKNGNFSEKEELLNISGIGEQTYLKLENRVIVR